MNIKEIKENKKGFKAFIFDLDGVLLSTDEFHYQAWKTISKKLGIQFDREMNKALRGIGRRESLERILEKCDRKVSEEYFNNLLEEKNTIYKSCIETLTPLAVDESVRLVLKKLHSQGFLLAIGSSSKNARHILEKTDMTKYFDAISDGTIISRSKPDPEVFIKAAELLGVSNEDCIVVEDADAGLMAANACGMYSIGINAASKSLVAKRCFESFNSFFSAIKQGEFYEKDI